MKVSDLVETLEGIAPVWLAEPWDNVGLLVGWPGRAVQGPVLLTIDLTRRVMDEAIAMGASVIVAYHPPIFRPVKSLVASDPKSHILLRAIEAGMAIYSPHTALDAAKGGVTDWLCHGISGNRESIQGDERALVPQAHDEPGQSYKIVTFVPEDQADRVRDALATAGTGQIGAYSVCSFATQGTGTFLGDESTNPVVGSKGSFERVAEIRLEMVCPRDALSLALQTLRRFHPYEEPPCDVYRLEPKPMRSAGAGRRIVLDKPASMKTLIGRLKKHLGVSTVRYALASNHTEPVEVIGVCPGSGASLARAARENGCQLFVTGEMSHHDVLAALDNGLSVLLAGHTNTERGYLPTLEKLIRNLQPGVEVCISKEDRDPLTVV